MNSRFSLSAAEITRYREQGFTSLDRVASDADIERLRQIFDGLFSARAGRDQGSHFDLAGLDDEQQAPVLPQIVNPVEFAPELATGEFRSAAHEIARQLLGQEAEAWFEHAILKPAGYGAPTPWHQDAAHRNDTGIDYEQLSIWMPLQAATVENGCMEFIPGSHRGPVLGHRSLGGNPRIMALECVDDFDRTASVACPLPAGGVTVHDSRTLHHAGANRSTVPRYAYILAFRGKPRPDPRFTGYHWIAEKDTAAQARRDAWDNRGGALGRTARRTRALLLRLRQKASRFIRSRASRMWSRR